MPFITTLQDSANRTVSKVHVRATLSLILTLGLVWGFVQGIIKPETYKDVTLIALVWYFSKGAENKGE